MLVLGIESSCDETAVAVVEDGLKIKSNIIASQIERHRIFGGVVPEVASRLHIESISHVCDEAIKTAGVTLDEIDAIAVTFAPGLIGALLAGVSFAKGLSFATGKPLIPVHHLRGHIASLYLTHGDLTPPFVAMVASGGHSHLIKVNGYTDFEILGKAVDDAAGEAFDKVARTLGLPYPGGVEIARLAKNGDKQKFKLPTPSVEGNANDISFSGLKTAVLNIVNSANMKGETLDIESLSASFQHKVVTMLATRLASAAKAQNVPAAICGGVSVNNEFQTVAQSLCDTEGIKLYIPHKSLCGDNAAMIASQGYFEYLDGNIAKSNQNAFARLDIE